MKTITKDFEQEIRKLGFVDTKAYRYTVDGSNGEIKRIRKEHLGTTAALTEWETVTVK